MNVDINIATQEEGKSRKLFLVLGILGIIYITLALAVPALGLRDYYFAWLVLLPGFIAAILYGLGKKRILAHDFPYLRVNEERIEKSRGGIFANPDIILWSDVKSIEIKLFEIHLLTKDDRPKKVALTNLTDENLKLVKDALMTIKKNKGR